MIVSGSCLCLSDLARETLCSCSTPMPTLATVLSIGEIQPDCALIQHALASADLVMPYSVVSLAMFLLRFLLFLLHVTPPALLLANSNVIRFAKKSRNMGTYKIFTRWPLRFLGRRWSRLFLLGLLLVLLIVTSLDWLFPDFEHMRTIDRVIVPAYAFLWLVLYWFRRDFFQR